MSLKVCLFLKLTAGVQQCILLKFLMLLWSELTFLHAVEGSVGCRYLQVVIQLTYRLTLPSDELFIPGTSRWCGGYSWHTDWHYPVMSCSFQVPPGGVEVTADVQTDIPQWCAFDCMYLQVVRRLQLMYKLTFPSDALLIPGTSRWCRGYTSCTNWHSTVMCFWLQVPPGGAELQLMYKLTFLSDAVLIPDTSRWLGGYSSCTDWHSTVMCFWLQVPPGGAEVTAHVKTRPVYPYGFTIIPMDSDLKFRCYASWVKNYGHCLIFPFPHFKLE